MRIQPAYHAPSNEDYSRPHCPRCGSVLLVAEESEFNLKGRIRHVWSCDECGNAFATSIVLRPR
jgi:RNase P subunit RPR2